MELHAQHAQMDDQGASQDRAIELASDSSSSSDAEPVETVQTPSPSSSTHDIRNGVLSAESLLQLGEALQPESIRKRGIAVVVYPVERAWEYRLYGGPAVSEILVRYDDGGFIEYLVRYNDESEEVLTPDQIHQLENGRKLLNAFNSQDSAASSADSGFSTSDELTNLQTTMAPAKARLRLRASASRRSSRQKRAKPAFNLLSMVSDSSSEDGSRRRQQGLTTHTRAARATRTATQKHINYSDAARLEDSLSEASEDDSVRLGKRKRTPGGIPGQGRIGRPRRRAPRLGTSSEEEERDVRRSGRNIRSRYSMRELGEDDIPELATKSGVVKYVGAKESFQILPDDDEFRLRHSQICDACFEADDSNEKGILVYCQGCTLSYHQKCLGPRNSRDHLATKIGDNDFILQCRRCIGFSKQKDPLSPDQGLCVSCLQPGTSTSVFRERKSTKEEQKEREENEGEDPVTDVSADLINSPESILFRCIICYRACHMYHLPRRGSSTITEGSEEQIAASRFREYSQTWFCADCSDAPAEVESLVAWRPISVDHYEPGQATHEVEEEVKEYLVKWKKRSYFEVQWMPGTWVWGVTSPAMRKAFARRNHNNNQPKMNTEAAVPEDYLRADIVLDVEYKDVVSKPTLKVAKARIKEVTRALIKFKGLGYEDVVWTTPPSQQDSERWADFQTAYDEWVMGSFIRQPVQKDLKAHLAQTRKQNFEISLEMKAQPETLTGGEMMEYQLSGLNWLYYKWYSEKNAILADEMGLGKTIQVIGFLATLKQRHGCWPFLIVVPNSTCPNWRREIQKWAPSLRVVTYFGSAEARRLSYKYELFPAGGKDLACHVVVTSYDTAQDDEFRRIFRGVHWAGMVVDEGQRLKNDKNLLYGALNALKPPFKLLLTGTPLQNNARELFNLLQFVDAKINADEMDQKYATLTKENVAELHEKLREFFLRRTKAQVLKFLPSMAQIILPVSMTTLQKKLYKSILAKNPELIKSIMNPNVSTAGKSRTNLNNILMELRKCLCHPFVYSQQIEERNVNSVASHRSLVEASSKLQLLEIMLPKLKERGHRVLIFSQFLDMLDVVEDFLDGIGLFHARLDGSVSSLQRQKRIDEFNAPDSTLFAFLLSTRAGGVGINLASADTVIILDPDFNPHQDIQALSRAHRIGQQKKVLVFQLTTRASAEEKILQIGKKKMALDHVLIEQMDAEDDAGMDLESILRHGTEALFRDDESENIRYDSASVDKLLDRSQIEDTQTDNVQSAESQFSFARVWANDKGIFEEGMQDDSEDVHAPDPSVWDAILKEREREAAEERAKAAQAFGRGRRKRQRVDYSTQVDRALDTPGGKTNSRGRGRRDTDSDTDFQEQENSEEDVPSGDEVDDQDSVQQLDGASPQQPSWSVVLGSQASPVPVRERLSHRPVVGSQASPIAVKGESFRLRTDTLTGLTTPPTVRPTDRLATGSQGSPTGNKVVRPFHRKVPHASPQGLSIPGSFEEPIEECPACEGFHIMGSCPLKIAGTEYCMLCGLPHYGHSRNCPHIGSVTQLRLMIDALKQSPEQADLVAIAKKKVVGLIGSINQDKKKKKERDERKQQLKEGVHQTGTAEPQQHPRLDGAKAVYPSAAMDHTPQGMGDPPMGTFHIR